MKKLHIALKIFILRLVGFFYPPFKKFMPLQTFRYAVCGGGNTALSIFVYFIAYNFIIQKRMIRFSFITISAHIAAYIISFIISFPIGFYLSLFVVFPKSYLRRQVQLFRYLLIVLICIFLNYIFLKIFVEKLGWYPTVSMIASAMIVVLFSYLSQRNFSFRTRSEPNEISAD